MNAAHPLLSAAALKAEVSFSDGSAATVAGTRLPGRDVGFALDLGPKVLVTQMTALNLTFSVDAALGGRSFRILTIAQAFTAIPAQPDGVAKADYQLTPGGWRDSVNRLRVSNAAVHPLMDTAQLAQ